MTKGYGGPAARNSTVQLILIVTVFIAVAIASDLALARDLVDAAASAQSAFNRIGIAAISIGFTLGGILYALGAAFIGRMLLVSGLIGAVAILAAPAVINALARIFGASV